MHGATHPHLPTCPHTHTCSRARTHRHTSASTTCSHRVAHPPTTHIRVHPPTHLCTHPPAHNWQLRIVRKHHSYCWAVRCISCVSSHYCALCKLSKRSPSTHTGGQLTDCPVACNAGLQFSTLKLHRRQRAACTTRRWQGLTLACRQPLLLWWTWGHRRLILLSATGLLWLSGLRIWALHSLVSPPPPPPSPPPHTHTIRMHWRTRTCRRCELVVATVQSHCTHRMPYVCISTRHPSTTARCSGRVGTDQLLELGNQDTRHRVSATECACGVCELQHGHRHRVQHSA
jgi:hypothetical protein